MQRRLRDLPATMILDPPKPKRRVMARVLWTLLIGVAIAVAIVVADTGRDTRADLDYVEALHDEVSAIALDAQSLQDVAVRLFSVDRVEFVTVTDGLRADIASAQARLEAGPPSDALVAVNQLYGQTLRAWSRGVSGFASGILVAADDPADEFAEDLIAESLSELRAGDELYLALLAELDMPDIPDPVSPMPEIEMMPAEGTTFNLARTYVSAARSPGNSLALIPGLGISQLVSAPSIVVGPDGQGAVPATDSMVFTAVITNSGNVGSQEETITLTMTGGPEPVELTATLPELNAGRQTTVAFEPIPVEGGLVYEVAAVLVVTSPDATLDDNERSVVFVVNEA